MRIGVPKEIKPDEYRVGMTPDGVRALTREGHTVLVEKDAGEGSSFDNEHYRLAGAQIVDGPEGVWAESGLVVKVKEPLVEEYRFFRSDLTLFTFLHLAPEVELTRNLMDSGIVAVAYETVQDQSGELPLLLPMSEVAGRMAGQVGAQFLERRWGGRGVLLGGVPGVLPGRVVVLGGGVVGTNAARIALGLGAEVTLIDINPRRLRELDDLFGGRVRTVISREDTIARAVESADLLVGAVLIPGARAPHLVTEEMVRSMTPGAVIVDVAVDQGGSVATVDHVTTHTHPTYLKHGVVHYAVANMPGAVPRTSTFALTNVTFPYVQTIARWGLEAALERDPVLAGGLNLYHGKVTHPAVAEAHGLSYKPPAEVLG